jgi:hypothetical protein
MTGLIERVKINGNYQVVAEKPKFKKELKTEKKEKKEKGEDK